MTRKPVQSLHVSFKPPAPHTRALRGAQNSGFEKTSPKVEKALMLKSPPIEVDDYAAPCGHEDVAGERLMRHVSWHLCCECGSSKNVTVGESATDGPRCNPRATKAARPHVSLSVEASEMGEDLCTRHKRVCVEQDGEVVAVGVRVEVVRDMWCMVTGFLEVHRLPQGSAWGSYSLGPGFHWSTERRYW